MSSAKSCNFRRRGGDEDDCNSSTPSSSASTKTNTTPSTNKPKKPIAKSLLSFADARTATFSRPSIKTYSYASRPSAKSSSAHKLISSKDGTVLHPPSSSLPSNVQPQAGLYTKEALLELQKNTRTIAGSSRPKPKPEVEPVIIVKGLVKPMPTTGFEAETNGHSQDSEHRGLERQDALALLGKVGLGPDLSEDDGMVMDQETIDAIRAKRERLRKAKPAAQDFISLDAGSNHGEAEGLSDEEPEFRERIGLFGEKVGDQNKKGVFEKI